MALQKQKRELLPEQAAAALVPLADMLPGLPAVVLTADEAARVSRGQEVRPGDTAQRSTSNLQPSAPSPQPSFVRLLDQRGDLVAMAQPTASGALHPSVVLV